MPKSRKKSIVARLNIFRKRSIEQNESQCLTADSAVLALVNQDENVFIPVNENHLRFPHKYQTYLDTTGVRIANDEIN